MSFEALLLLLVFIVLPLIEQAIRNARRKREGGAPAARREPAPQPARAPQAPGPFDEDEENDDEEAFATRPPAPPQRPTPRPAPGPAPVVHRPSPPPAPPVPADVLLAARARLDRLAPSASPELAAGRARRLRRVRLPELRRPASLKRAIVLQAVLGPCRANDPHA